MMLFFFLTCFKVMVYTTAGPCFLANPWRRDDSFQGSGGRPPTKRQKKTNHLYFDGDLGKMKGTVHPRRLRLEPENDGLEDDFPIFSSSRDVFSGSMLIFRGVIYFTRDDCFDG